MATPKKVAEKVASKKEVSIPSELESTLKGNKELKGAYLFSDGVWFFYNSQASKYEQDKEGISRRFIANPSYK